MDFIQNQQQLEHKRTQRHPAPIYQDYTQPGDPHWSRSNFKRARFESYCQACFEPIALGDAIGFHLQLRRFVHLQCSNAATPNTPVLTETNPLHPPPQSATRSEDILSPGSPLDKLSPSYRQEAVRWIQFHADQEFIPGIHIDFSNREVIRYLKHRSRTTKALVNIVCALKQMGMLCGYVLASNKHQQPSIQYQQVHFHRTLLLKERREAGLDGYKRSPRNRQLRHLPAAVSH